MTGRVRRITRRTVADAIPAFEWLPSWRDGLAQNALAALGVWAVLVPQSMAYASLAGVPPVNGLYTAVVALVVYAILGTSRQLNVGPSSGVAVLSAATVAPLAARRQRALRHALRGARGRDRRQCSSSRGSRASDSSPSSSRSPSSPAT